MRHFHCDLLNDCSKSFQLGLPTICSTPNYTMGDAVISDNGRQTTAMSTQTRPSFPELFRATPVKSTLLAVVPLGLALGQLANSYVNGVSPVIAVGFAVVMIAFAVVATGHHAAEYRLRRLEAAPDEF